MIVLSVVLAVLPGTAAAATRAGGTVIVDEGETVTGGLDVFAGSVTIYGTVEGDLTGLAGTITIYGTVTGDVTATAGTIEIAPGAVVGDDVSVAAGTLRIAGTVQGDVDAGAETIVLASTATVVGDLTYGGTLTQESGAVVGGTVAESDALSVGLFTVPSWVPDLYVFLLGLLTLGILVALFPGTADRIGETGVADPVRAGLAGIVTLVAVPIVLVLLAVTIVGLPLSILGVLLFVFVAWIGSLYGRLVVGTWLLGYTESENRWVGVGIGFLAVALAIRIPVLGGLIGLVVFLLGLGALALVLTRAYRGSDRDQSDTTDDPIGPGEDASRPA